MIILKFNENVELTNNLINLSKLVLVTILKNTIYKNGKLVNRITEFNYFNLSDLDYDKGYFYNFIKGDYGKNFYIFFINIDKENDGFENSVKGRYVSSSDNNICNIHLKIDNKEYEYYNKILQEEEKNNKEDILEYHFLKKFLSTFIHEFTHAYDDYRSNFKMIGKIKNKTSIEGYKKYLNYSYEIHARFNALIQDLNFYDVDIDTENECFVSTKKPFNYCLTNFKNRINYGIYCFDFFTKLNKNKILKKFYKYYLSLPDKKIDK